MEMEETEHFECMPSRAMQTSQPRKQKISSYLSLFSYYYLCGQIYISTKNVPLQYFILGKALKHHFFVQSSDSKDASYENFYLFLAMVPLHLQNRITKNGYSADRLFLLSRNFLRSGMGNGAYLIDLRSPQV